MDHIKLLNYFINKYQYKTYLEIGCAKNECFDKIKIEHKFGCDPASGGTHRMTSDEFFEQNKMTFDLVLVDGLHWCEQVLKDVNNSLNVLNENGLIVLHDCNPTSEDIGAYPYRGTYSWTGDCWKALVHLRQRDDLDIATGDFDWGCGVVKRRTNTDRLTLDREYNTLTYQDLEDNRHQWLRLKTFPEILRWLDAAQ